MNRMAAGPGGDDRGPDTPSPSEATSRLVEIALKVKGKMLAPPSGGGDALAESRIEDQGAKRIVILQLSVRVAKNTFQEKPRLGTLGGVFLSMAVPMCGWPNVADVQFRARRQNGDRKLCGLNTGSLRHCLLS